MKITASPFIAIILFIIALNFLYVWLQIRLLRRRKPSMPWVELVLVGWASVMSGLLLVQVFAPWSWSWFIRHYLYLPMGMEMIWNLIFVQFMVLLLAAIHVGLHWFRPVNRLKPLTPQGITRRKFLYLFAVGTAPATALGMGVHGLATRHDLRVRELSIPVTGLPPELEGFKIAHVSDPHSGIFCGPTRLKIISDRVNDLEADLVAITGDIINRDMGEFEAVLRSIQSMESRHGIYLCEGNHDRIPGKGLVPAACAANNLPMLLDQSTIVSVDGRRLILGGVPWLDPGPQDRSEMVSKLYPPRQEGDVRVLLAHHPHFFDIAGSTDLVLTGHTHGGQLMLNEEVGFGPMFFRYWSGPYYAGRTTLVVSNGCGDWFPCRINAPAEIGLLRLTKA